MIKLAIVIGSTRPGRKGEAVAQWVHAAAARRTDLQAEIVDLATVALPAYDEPIPPSMGKYTHEHTKRWAATVASYDAFVFVTPEYNHAPPASLKNALDFIYGEWNNKVAGFVGYGSLGGARAVEQLRLIMAELQVATVRAQVALSLFTDFENFSTFKPQALHDRSMTAMFDQLVAWGGALKTLRG